MTHMNIERGVALLFFSLLLLACNLGTNLNSGQEAVLPTPTQSEVELRCGDQLCETIKEIPDCMKDCGPNPFIHNIGTTLVDGNGEPIKLRGVNLGGWLHWEGWIWGGGLNGETAVREQLTALVGADEMASFEQQIYQNFITEADIARIANLGFNVVRLPINHRLLEDDDQPFVYKQSGWDILDQFLDWCEKYNVYVVLTLHATPGGQSRLFTADPDPSLLWSSEKLQTRTAALWQAIAQRYKDREIIAGYDLLNEPAPPENQDLLALYQLIIAAIRSVDPHHMVILEGADLAHDFSLFEGPLSHNQAYSFHMYTWVGDKRTEQLADYNTIAEAHQVPMWNGEFGENEYEMLSSTIGLFEQTDNNLVGWAFWTWKKAPNQYPYLMGINVPDDWQTVMDWVEWPKWPNTQPSAEDTQAAMAAFLRAISTENLLVDEKMVSSLIQWKDLP